MNVCPKVAAWTVEASNHVRRSPIMLIMIFTCHDNLQKALILTMNWTR